MYLENLFLAITQLFESNSVRNFLLNLDRLGNALCSGCHQFTVSARVGYFVTYRNSYYWEFVRWVIDSTFYPLDGRGHCVAAYKWEALIRKTHPGTEYRRSNDVALFFLSALVVVSCALIFIPLFLYSKYLRLAR